MPSVMWTKHHFEDVAQVLHYAKPARMYRRAKLTQELAITAQGYHWEKTIRMFADTFGEANDHFEAGTFLRACGMDGTAILEYQQRRAKELEKPGADVDPGYEAAMDAASKEQPND